MTKAMKTLGVTKADIEKKYIHLPYPFCCYRAREDFVETGVEEALVDLRFKHY
jgi:hypothetical protein